MNTSETYFIPTGDRSLAALDGTSAPGIANFIHRQFRTLVSEAGFPCIGASAAVRPNSYRFGLYETMRPGEAAPPLGKDLLRFISERSDLPGEFNTFIAAFRDPLPVDENHFELLLWSLLQGLHRLDSEPWDPLVSADPDNSTFEFSFGGQAFFIVGLHAASSRWSRRFAWPVLVFNGHDQFERLRDTGKMSRYQKTIRGRDTDLQGSINPNLANFGDASGARQYSGRRTEEEWLCPFRTRVDPEQEKGAIPPT